MLTQYWHGVVCVLLTVVKSEMWGPKYIHSYLCYVIPHHAMQSRVTCHYGLCFVNIPVAYARMYIPISLKKYCWVKSIIPPQQLANCLAYIDSVYVSSSFTLSFSSCTKRLRKSRLSEVPRLQPVCYETNLSGVHELDVSNYVHTSEE